MLAQVHIIIYSSAKGRDQDLVLMIDFQLLNCYLESIVDLYYFHILNYILLIQVYFFLLLFYVFQLLPIFSVYYFLLQLCFFQLLPISTVYYSPLPIYVFQLLPVSIFTLLRAFFHIHRSQSSTIA